MSEAGAERSKALEKENAELKKMYFLAKFGIEVLKESIEKTFKPHSSPQSWQVGQEG